MPIIEYRCNNYTCRQTSEKIALSQRLVEEFQRCPYCNSFAFRIMSAPRSPKMDDGSARKRRERIKEPIWRYPDGKIEAVNP